MAAMEDLAPDIVRQRLLIEGYFTVAVDEDVIRAYFDRLTTALALRTYDTPIIFSPGSGGREENAGYDAFVPLIDSGISLYVWTGPRFLSVVTFTCKAFDAGARCRRDARVLRHDAAGVRGLLTSSVRADDPADAGWVVCRTDWPTRRRRTCSQHADNPVDWYEWGDEAFAAARERDVPVFLSVGYAACHWCHVMAHESFEHGPTAAYLNQHFVSVKVDREERPDIDAVYMEATQAMTGQGGWPMTCILTPDGEPFFAGTYFPRAARTGCRRSARCSQAVVKAWTDRRDEVTKIGADIAQHLQRDHELPPSSVGRRDRRTRSTSSAPTFDQRTPASAAHRSSRRRWCASSCSGTRRARATPRRC